LCHWWPGGSRLLSLCTKYPASGNPPNESTKRTENSTVVAVDHSFGAEGVLAEVQQKAYAFTGSTQISTQLGMVDIQQQQNGFQLHDDPVSDQEVKDMLSHKLPVVVDVDLYLSLETQALLC